MLTAKQIVACIRMEESLSNARAGLWRCSACEQTYRHGTVHECDHEDLERLTERRREIGTGALR